MGSSNLPARAGCPACVVGEFTGLAGAPATRRKNIFPPVATGGRRTIPLEREVTMRKRFTALALAAAVVLVLGACATAPRSAEDRQALRETADVALSKARASDPSLAGMIRAASAYAVFPSVGKGGVGVGGAYGQGVLYEHGVFSGYCDMTQASIGFQFGGQSYTEIILLENGKAVKDFKSGDLALAAQASAVALKSGAAANAKYDNGVVIFTMDQAGLMYEASIGGQKFTFERG
jgi:lipid-binding SYLF domain-containing protein